MKKKISFLLIGVPFSGLAGDVIPSPPVSSVPNSSEQISPSISEEQASSKKETNLTSDFKEVVGSGEKTSKALEIGYRDQKRSAFKQEGLTHSEKSALRKQASNNADAEAGSQKRLKNIKKYAKLVDMGDDAKDCLNSNADACQRLVESLTEDTKLKYAAGATRCGYEKEVIGDFQNEACLSLAQKIVDDSIDASAHAACKATGPMAPGCDAAWEAGRSIGNLADKYSKDFTGFSPKDAVTGMEYSAYEKANYWLNPEDDPESKEFEKKWTEKAIANRKKYQQHEAQSIDAQKVYLEQPMSNAEGQGSNSGDDNSLEILAPLIGVVGGVIMNNSRNSPKPTPESAPQSISSGPCTCCCGPKSGPGPSCGVQ